MSQIVQVHALCTTAGICWLLHGWLILELLADKLLLDFRWAELIWIHSFWLLVELEWHVLLLDWVGLEQLLLLVWVAGAEHLDLIDLWVASVTKWYCLFSGGIVATGARLVLLDLWKWIILLLIPLLLWMGEGVQGIQVVVLLQVGDVALGVWLAVE